MQDVAADATQRVELGLAPGEVVDRPVAGDAEQPVAVLVGILFYVIVDPQTTEGAWASVIVGFLITNALFLGWKFIFGKDKGDEPIIIEKGEDHL